jgi:hypothetical protein
VTELSKRLASTWVRQPTDAVDLVIIIVILTAPDLNDGSMSAPAEIMFRKRSATRPPKLVGAWFKSFFVKLYVALDKSQRKRAAEIIRRYGHLIPDGDDSPGEQK